MTENNKQSMTYRDSGVDIDAGNYSVELIKSSVKSTYRKEVLGDLGGFGGLFALDISKYKQPVLVSGTDGVGTKLRLAFMLDEHTTIGQDAVAMCVNDILVQGAEPLYFLDYLAVGKLNPIKVEKIVRGVANACKESGCALIGGETAEMAGFYSDDEYDIAGFAVGVVDKSKIITGDTILEGDYILGLPSSGCHSNGYSLIRKICFEHKKFTGNEKFAELNNKTLGEVLLTPTKLYSRICLPLIEKYPIKGMVHITGGGFYENIIRVLPSKLDAKINLNAWEMPAIFKLLQEWGNVDWHEMYRVFNMGIGMIIIASKDDVYKMQEELSSKGEKSFILGEITKGKRNVILEGGVLNE